MRCQPREAKGYSRTSSHVREPDQAPPAAAGREGGDTDRSERQAGLVGLEDCCLRALVGPVSSAKRNSVAGSGGHSTRRARARREVGWMHGPDYSQGRIRR